MTGSIQIGQLYGYEDNPGAAMPEPSADIAATPNVGGGDAAKWWLILLGVAVVVRFVYERAS